MRQARYSNVQRTAVIRKHNIGVEHYNAEELYKYCCHMCGDLFLRGSFLTKHLKTDHNLHKPAGLKCFRYIEDDEGYYKLQTSRYECLDIQEQNNVKLLNPNKLVVRKKTQTTCNDKQAIEFVVDFLSCTSDDQAMIILSNLR